MKRTRAFLLGGGGLLLGLALSTIFSFPVFALAVGSGLIGIALFSSWRFLPARRVFTFLACSLVGILWTTSGEAYQASHLLIGRTMTVTGEIASCRLSFRSSHCLVDINKSSWRLSVTVPGEPTPGSLLTVSGAVRPLSQKLMYLKADGVAGILEEPTVQRIIPGRNWRSLLFALKRRCEQLLTASLPEPASSLAAGLLFGSRQVFSDAFLEALRRTNTLHIIAVSGFNITILAEFFRRLFSFLSRRTTFVVSSIAITMFVMMIGAPPSAVRAGIMGVALLLGRVIGRRPYVPSLVLLTALLMALPNPFILRYDLGFQLSFLAFMGLVWLGPLFEKSLLMLPGAVRGLAASTLGATVATAPVLISMTKVVSLVGPFVNLLILPIIPLLMLLSGLTLAASIISLGLGSVVGLLLFLPSHYLTTVVERGAALPLASTHWAIGITVFAVTSLLITLFRRRHAFSYKKGVLKSLER